MRLLSASLLAVALATVPGPRAAAQDFADLCRQHRRFTNGQWASYRSTGRGEDSGTMKFAIVGMQGTGDAARLTYEMAFATVRRGKPESSIIRMEVVGLGTLNPQVFSFVMKAGDRPAMKMPDQMVSMVSRQALANVASEIAKNCDNAHVVGWESVTVPAGTFRALHVRTDEGGDAWVTRDVPFGMVKVREKNGVTMVLTGRGTGAKTAITETPQDMMGGRH